MLFWIRVFDLRGTQNLQIDSIHAMAKGIDWSKRTKEFNLWGLMRKYYYKYFNLNIKYTWCISEEFKVAAFQFWYWNFVAVILIMLAPAVVEMFYSYNNAAILRKAIRLGLSSRLVRKEFSCLTLAISYSSSFVYFELANFWSSVQI